MLYKKLQSIQKVISAHVLKTALVLAFTFFSFLLHAQADSYLLHRGDILVITVMEHPEFTVEGVLVMPDGYIQYPGLGNVKCADVSLKDFTKIMNDSIGKYVVNPIVTVFLRQLPSQIINIVGFVNKPGQIEVFEPIDLISALSRAGGIKFIDKCKYIKIIRADQTTQTLSVRKLFSTKNTDKFPMLNVGDTVYVVEPKEINWSQLSFFTTAAWIVISIVKLL